MDRNFGGIIWTNHAMDRMRERGIKQGDAWATWNRPEKSYKSTLHKEDSAWRYYKTYGSERIEVVAKKNEKGQWVVLSVWSKPEYQKTSKKSSIWGLLFKKLFNK